MSIPEGKWAFIDNPVAGSGFGGRYLPHVREEIKRYHPGADIFTTEYHGHAIELTAELVRKKYTHIIAVGGDGTINEVVQSLAGHPDVIFGAVSAGSGNDFIHSLGFPERFTEEDWQTLFQANTTCLDLCRCNNRFFINTIGIGFDAQVAADFNKMKIRNGKIRYWIALLKNLLFFKPVRLKITSEQYSTEDNMFMISIGNGRSSGGGFTLLQDAMVNDGLVDASVFLGNRQGLLKRVSLLTKVLKGTHSLDPTVTQFRSTRIVVETDREVPLHIDGELFQETRLDITIFPASVNVIYHPGRPNYLKV